MKRIFHKMMTAHLLVVNAKEGSDNDKRKAHKVTGPYSKVFHLLDTSCITFETVLNVNILFYKIVGLK